MDGILHVLLPRNLAHQGDRDALVVITKVTANLCKCCPVRTLTPNLGVEDGGRGVQYGWVRRRWRPWRRSQCVQPWTIRRQLCLQAGHQAVPLGQPWKEGVRKAHLIGRSGHGLFPDAFPIKAGDEVFEFRSVVSPVRGQWIAKTHKILKVAMMMHVSPNTIMIGFATRTGMEKAHSSCKFRHLPPVLVGKAALAFNHLVVDGADRTFPSIQCLESVLIRIADAIISHHGISKPGYQRSPSWDIP